MLWFAAAASAPARILSQNVSPGASWVTIAMVKLSPSAAPPPPSLWAPPSLLHAASARVATLTTTTAGARSFLREGPIFIDFLSPGSRPGGGLRCPTGRGDVRGRAGDRPWCRAGRSGGQAGSRGRNRLERAGQRRSAVGVLRGRSGSPAAR